jgi:hypothetical protein
VVPSGVKGRFVRVVTEVPKHVWAQSLTLEIHGLHSSALRSGRLNTSERNPGGAVHSVKARTGLKRRFAHVVSK